jgi:hypothetical protein
LQLPLLAMLTVLDGATFFGTSLLFASHLPSWDAFLPLLGWQLFANLLIGPVVLLMFAALDHKLKRPKRFGWRRHESAITFQPK